jgi:hypothetical protein
LFWGSSWHRGREITAKHLLPIVFAGYHLPKVVASSFELIGSATSGVVFAVGLVLAAHPMSLCRNVLIGTLGRITVQSGVYSLFFIFCTS